MKFMNHELGIMNYAFKFFISFLFVFGMAAVARAETVGVTVSYNGFEIPDASVSMYDNNGDFACAGNGMTDSGGVAIFTVNTANCDVNTTTFTIEANKPLSGGETQRGIRTGASLQGGQDFYSFEVTLQPPSSGSGSGGLGGSGGTDGSGAGAGGSGAGGAGGTTGSNSGCSTNRFFFPASVAYAADSKVSGIVVGNNNQGVANIKVTALQGTQESTTVTTNSNGGFSVTIPTPFFNASAGSGRQISVLLVAKKTDGTEVGRTTVTAIEDQTVSANITANVPGTGAQCPRPTGSGGAGGTTTGSVGTGGIPLKLQTLGDARPLGSFTSYIVDKATKSSTGRGPWASILALTNIVVVLVLLGVAFATIFHIQVDTYGIKKVLPALIVGVILSNLSLLISKNIIDFAQVLSATFIGSNSNELVDGLSKALIGGAGVTLGEFASKPEGFLTGTATIVGIGVAATITGLAPLAIIATLLLLALLLLLPAILFGILAFLLYARTVILIFLVAVSPVAFIAMAFPPTQSLFRQWWTQFLRWVFMAPVVFFLLWLAKEFTPTGGGNLASYALVLILTYLAIQVPFKLGGAVMSVYGGVGKKLATFAGTKGSSYGQGLAERKGYKTPRALLQGYQQRSKHMEERFLTERSAEAEGGFSKRLGTGERGLLQIYKEKRDIAAWNKEHPNEPKVDFETARAENRERALKRQQMYREAEIFGSDPEMLERLAKNDERFQNGDGASVIADLKQRSGKSTAKNTETSVAGILNAGDKEGTAQAKQQANNDVSQLLRQILTAIRTQVTNKEYDKGLAAYLGVIASDEKLKGRGFDPSTIESFSKLEEYDKTNKLEGTDQSVAKRFKQGVATELGMREQDLENMSGSSVKRFQEFAGIDRVKEWIKVAAPRGQQGPQLIVPPKIGSVDVSPVVKQLLESIQGVSDSSALSNEQAANIAVHFTDAKQIVESIKTEYPEAKIENVMKIINENPLGPHNTQRISDATRQELEGYKKIIEGAPAKLISIQKQLPLQTNPNVIATLNSQKIALERELKGLLPDFAFTNDKISLETSQLDSLIKETLVKTNAVIDAQIKAKTPKTS